MLLIECPYCREPRPEIEFQYAGEAHVLRPDGNATVTDAQWAEYLYFRSNPRGLHRERWWHTHGCARFFNAVRDTESDAIVVTYPARDPPPPTDSESITPP
jgi:sarcosine oxidase, subunit delta